ncbi:MAG TPA: aldo/keto reductase [Thermoanaerobaculia bacterium]|nr:aldo/keto reductase [Thermoanaerobaculia bacterium]
MGESARKTIAVQGIDVPRLLYGTAWKEERTAELVGAALDAGFRGIDTANQRRHYHEAAVGEAITGAIGRGVVRRDELFLQTKFTYVEGQDARLPYDPEADHTTQVWQSFRSSLEHLGVERIDAFLLHGPRSRRGLSEADLEVWRTMEDLQREGGARLIGVSNVTAGQLAELCGIAEVPPALVQNRCFARLGWDREVRAVCREKGVVYQGFSLLTANLTELSSPTILRLAAGHGKTAAQIAFRFAIQLGMICLTGTTDPRHMRDDLDVFDFELSEGEIAAIEGSGLAGTARPSASGTR